ncbi:MAG TPA: rRNA maturation RNase YbeY [Actinobacteria bacterium]|nr:rRNA maturation RNase YbeY [Actinomycetota bacterium]
MQIKLINNQNKVKFDFKSIEGYSDYISNKFDLDNNRSINIIFVTSGEIQKLNKSYRNIDRPTDVLSFSYLCDIDDSGAAAGPIVIGEIYISPEAALDNSREQEDDWDIDQEIMLLIIHGMLHVYDYDHEDEEKKAEMYNIQDSIIHYVKSKNRNRY